MNGPAVWGEQLGPHDPMKNLEARIFGRSESTGFVCVAVSIASPVACAVTVLTIFCPDVTAVKGGAKLAVRTQTFKELESDAAMAIEPL
jgi:hypothetical protein